MANLAIDLNDAALAVVDGGAVLLCEPGLAALVAGDMRFGSEAAVVARLFPRQANRRYWRSLDEVELAQPLAGFRTAADLVHAHLARLWARRPTGSDSVVLAVPGHWTTAQLALLLGICKDLGLGVTGLVDSAVAASRRPYADADLWHIEASLHDICLTHIEQGTGASIGARYSLQQTGIESLERACAEFIARHFVSTTRFDPLHDAASEQAIYDRLGEWLAALSRRDTIDLCIDYRGQSFSAPVTAAALRDVVARALQPVIQKLRALLPARKAVILQVHHRLTEMPGLLDELAGLPGSVVVALEPAAAARGALRWRGRATEPGAARLLTELPWDQAPGDYPGPPAAPPGAAPAGAPTHVLFEGRAYRLGTTPLQIGTELNAGEYGVMLGTRVPGASRRHCTLRLEDGRAMIYDQSRFGTLLNGHRIEGAAVLRAGDLIGIGQPPRELQLIAEVTDGGA